LWSEALQDAPVALDILWTLLLIILLKDTDKGKLFSKQDTDQGIKVGVSSEVQDEVLKKKYRTIPNDSD
jgi:hypothetical protein